MAKPRIPLPKQTEQVHRDRKSQYDRRRAKQVSLESSEWLVECPTCGTFIQVQKVDPTICPKCHRPDIDTTPANKVSLEDAPCLRDLKMDLVRENFDKGQVSEKEFEGAILRADKVCAGCPDPVCRFPKGK